MLTLSRTSDGLRGSGAKLGLLRDLSSTANPEAMVQSCTVAKSLRAPATGDIALGKVSNVSNRKRVTNVLCSMRAPWSRSRFGAWVPRVLAPIEQVHSYQGWWSLHH